MTSIQLDQPYSKHLELTDVQLDDFITQAIEIIQSKHNLEDIIICMHPKVLDCLISSEFRFKIDCTKLDSRYQYGWCHRFPISITEECIIRVMIEKDKLNNQNMKS